MITTAVFAATSIASEKESRSLEMLLTTPLSDWHVLAAFVVETLRRSAAVWAIVAAHILLFTVFLVIHPIGLLNVAMICAGAFSLLTGTGLYFSCHFRRPSQAVVMNLAAAAGLWLILPSLLAMGGAYGAWDGTAEWLSTFNPVVQAGIIVSEATGDGPMEFDWPLGSMGPGETTLAVLGSMLLHMAIGAFLIWRAKLKLRRKLF
jgi:ABC-type transport system involved in multi-copper enzyme maturation permease subunit